MLARRIQDSLEIASVRCVRDGHRNVTIQRYHLPGRRHADPKRQEGVERGRQCGHEMRHPLVDQLVAAHRVAAVPHVARHVADHPSALHGRARSVIRTRAYLHQQPRAFFGHGPGQGQRFSGGR